VRVAVEAQRKQMKAMLTELESKHPTLRQTMLAAMGNVNPSHLFDKSCTRHDAESAREGAADVSQPQRAARDITPHHLARRGAQSWHDRCTTVVA
jgi:hypothetical protein